MADRLLMLIDKADGDETETAESPLSSAPSGAAPNLVQPTAKRSQVTVACQICRRRRVKVSSPMFNSIFQCDGQRPCAPCTSRSLDCAYETQAGETHARASKRKFDEVVRANEVYEQLYHLLRSRDEEDALEIVRRIRSDQSAMHVLEFAISSPILRKSLDSARLALGRYLVALAHSTGSLRKETSESPSWEAREVTDLAMVALSLEAHVRLPSLTEYAPFRNHIVRIPQMQALIQRAKRIADLPENRDERTRSLENGSASTDREDPAVLPAPRDSAAESVELVTVSQPPYMVPAAPWTSLTSDDEAVSHLVSLFLVWINPTWRFVDPDVFIKGQSGKYSLGVGSDCEKMH
ncbi:hypothetical protein LTR86_008360 [Recurvomyces mirabilis]|nr:hypothetical protein LTR86_008360 [Recurvomyces mirabilis]